MGARELSNTDPAGKTVAAQLRRPSIDIERAVVSIYFLPLSCDTSVGVAHGISPSQKAGLFVRGVAPETMSQTSLN
jgi:hypothetical protein